MSKDIVSKICEIELYLTKKIIDNRNTKYKPIEGDEDQGLRDELKTLRDELNGEIKRSKRD